MAIIKNKIKENFSVIPNEILTNKSLKDGDYRLLLHLYHLPSNWTVNQEQLGKEFGICREQINRRITNLREAGFVAITKKKINQAEWEYTYTLTIPDVTNISQQQMSHHEMSLLQMSQPNNTKDKQILNINNTKYNIPPIVPQYEIMFNTFWEEYPRKESKLKAKTKFISLKPSEETFNKMIESLTYYKNSKQWQKDNGEYIPYAITWLNQERWKDEINIKTGNNFTDMLIEERKKKNE